MKDKKIKNWLSELVSWLKKNAYIMPTSAKSKWILTRFAKFEFSLLDILKNYRLLSIFVIIVGQDNKNSLKDGENSMACLWAVNIACSLLTKRLYYLTLDRVTGVVWCLKVSLSLAPWKKLGILRTSHLNLLAQCINAGNTSKHILVGKLMLTRHAKFFI